MVNDNELETRWQQAVEKLKPVFGDDIDVQSAIFLVGARELGKGYQRFTKDQKMDVMHIGVCRLLEPYGYYELTGLDKDGWPHFKRLKRLPKLSTPEQDKLMKMALIAYMEEV